MVVGIEKFREYFKDFSGSYIIIGGTACDIILDDAGLTPRATKDIDIILVVEALKPEFVKQFWSFIKEGNYEQKEKSPDERKYYRFLKPANKEFPKQIELFSRIPDLLSLKEESHLTPIPVDDDISNLSAILLNEDYYSYILKHSTIEDELNIANTEALICLKAKAFLDMTARKTKDEQVDEKHIRKHKSDVFRMAVMLAPDNVFNLPDLIKTDMQAFADTVKNELPGKAIFKEMGLGNMDVKLVFDQLIKNFKLNE